MEITSRKSTVLETIGETHAQIGTDFARLPTDGNTKGYDVGTTDTPEVPYDR